MLGIRIIVFICIFALSFLLTMASLPTKYSEGPIACVALSQGQFGGFDIFIGASSRMFWQPVIRIYGGNGVIADVMPCEAYISLGHKRIFTYTIRSAETQIARSDLCRYGKSLSEGCH